MTDEPPPDSTSPPPGARFGSMRGQWQRVKSSAAPDALVLYYAYGSSGTAVLEGRVIDHQILHAHAAVDSRTRNLRRNLQLLFNKERGHLPVNATVLGRRWQVRTDVEGYFRIEMQELDPLASGWHRVEVTAGAASAHIPLLLVPSQNVHGVISDFDDTLMITEVNRRWRMLANTFFRNPLQRTVVPGMPSLFRTLAARNEVPAAAPMFFLSASPRQLHMPLQAVLDHNGFPPGVLITKRVTNDSTREPILDQMRYKLTRIEEILARTPGVRFTLIGDDGEHDPEIFHEVRERHPARIQDVWIRRVHPDPQRSRLAKQGDVSEFIASLG
jgi:phosphatidate phosphatase APP1